jgi:hypothetical protein
VFTQYGQGNGAKMSSSSPLEAVTSEERKSRISLAIRQEVAAGGRVESQTDYTAIVRYEKSVNHILHLILTIVTAGLWAIVWVILSIVAAAGRKSVALTVDEYGQVLRERM